MEKKNILIVEDEAILALQIKDELLQMGHCITAIYPSGEKALKGIEAARPDLVLMDIKLNGKMDGIETAERINKQYDIPVIYMTAHSEEGMIERAKMTEPYGYLLKPVNVKELQVAVEVALYKAKIDKEKAELTQKLRESDERLTMALKSAGQSIYDSNLKTGEAIVSSEYALMLGYDPAEFYETTAKWIKRLHPDDKKRVAAVYRAYVKGEIPEYKVEFRQKTKDGGWKWILSLGKIIERDADGNPLRMIGTHSDITERKQAEEKIHYLATHDALTNLPTMGLVKDRILMALERAKRNETLVAIMYVDLDGFKDINDRYGHDSGDILLKEVGRRLVSCVRKVDTVARIGGDEFLLLLTELQSPYSAGLVAQKALRLVSEPFSLHGKHETVGVSIGIALYPDHGDDADSLINQADKAMYVIKNSGKNGYTFVNTAK